MRARDSGCSYRARDMSNDDQPVFRRPRYNEWRTLRGEAYVAYPDDDVADALSDETALNRTDFGALSRSAHFDFVAVEVTHWLFDVAPYHTDEHTRIFWFRRPRSYLRVVAGDDDDVDYRFPWQIGDQVTFFRLDTHSAAFRVQLEAYAVERRAATGYIVTQLVD